MKILICFALAACLMARASAQTAVESPPAVSTPASSAEVQALRDEVRSLKELVQTLQQQVKSQPPAANTSNPDQPTLPEKAETPTAETSASPGPSASAPPLFPTTDTAVVASAPKVDANGTTTFPTTDESVTTTAPSPTTTSETAAVKAMFGEIAIGGHLPVTIPGIAKYGDGLQLPATRTPLPSAPTARLVTRRPNQKGS